MAPGHASGAAGLFGKLPSADDFLHLDPPVSDSAFTTWLQHGVERASVRPAPDFAERYDAAGARVFVFRQPDQSLMAGVLLPSRDRVGRRFPVSVYAPLSSDALLAAPHVVPLVLGQFLESIGSVVLSRVNDADAGTVQRAVASLHGPDPNTLLTYAAEYGHWAASSPLSSVWPALFGDPGAERAYFTLVAICASLGSFRGVETPPTPLAVRLPLGAAGVAGAVFWLDVVRRAACWQRTVPTCFWYLDAPDSAILIQLGETPPATFAELFRPDEASDHVVDLRAGPQGDWSHALNAVPSGVGAVVGRPEASVAELLGALSG
ncbi:MAG TPA: type VI secretion system-associated protein TagF [Polyangiaceae bacterium]